MVYFTDVLGQPRDTNLKPRVRVSAVAYKNALMRCFINPGLEFTLNLIYGQKQDSGLLKRMGFSTHRLFTTCLSPS